MTQRDPGSTNFDPKHRIIGAIVIVALAVIFLPMILSERQPPAAPTAPAAETPTTTQTGSDATKVAVTVVTPPLRSTEKPKTELPKAETAATAVSASIAAAPAPAVASETSRAAAPIPPSSPSKPAAAAAKPTSASKSTSATTKPISHGWVVQVGTFASSANAARVQDKLRSLGQPVQAESVDLQSGKAVRVRVGPFRERTGAVKAQERIQKETGMKVVVLAYP